LSRLLPASHKHIFIALAALLAIVFLSPDIANRTGAEDAFMYAHEVEEFNYPQLLHPHHRLYHVFAKALYDLSGAERAFPVMLWLSIISGLLTLILAYFLLIRLIGANPWQALVSTSLIAFSNGFWRYTHEVETCTFTTLVALLFVAVAFKTGPTVPGCIYAALAGTAALLVHMALLPLVLGALPAWLIWHRAWTPLVVYPLLLGATFLTIDHSLENARLVAGPPYFTPVDTDQATVQYDPPPTTHRLSATQPIKAGVGFGQAFADASAIFAIAPLRTLLTDTLFPYRQLHEQTFLVRHMNLPTALMLLGMAVATALYFAFWVLRTLITFLRQHNGLKFTQWQPTHAFFWAWAAGTILMVFLFEPDNPEMWVVAMVPIQFSLAALWKITGQSWQRPGAILVALLITTNFFGGLRLLANPANDYHHATSIWTRQNASTHDLMVIAELRPNYERYLRYKSPVRILNVFYIDADEAMETLNTLTQDTRHIIIHERIARENLIDADNINNLRQQLAPDLHPLPNAPREFLWQPQTLPDELTTGE